MYPPASWPATGQDDKPLVSLPASYEATAYDAQHEQNWQDPAFADTYVETKAEDVYPPASWPAAAKHDKPLVSPPASYEATAYEAQHEQDWQDPACAGVGGGEWLFDDAQADKRWEATAYEAQHGQDQKDPGQWWGGVVWGGAGEGASNADKFTFLASKQQNTCKNTIVELFCILLLRFCFFCHILFFFVSHHCDLCFWLVFAVCCILLLRLCLFGCFLYVSVIFMVGNLS